MNNKPEDVTQLHDRITITFSAEITKMIRQEAAETGDKIEDIIDKAVRFHCELGDQERNFDMVMVRKARKS
jgi:hypothetical protein